MTVHYIPNSHIDKFHGLGALKRLDAERRPRQVKLLEEQIANCQRQHAVLLAKKDPTGVDSCGPLGVVRLATFPRKAKLSAFSWGAHVGRASERSDDQLALSEHLASLPANCQENMEEQLNQARNGQGLNQSSLYEHECKQQVVFSLSERFVACQWQVLEATAVP